MSLYDPDANVNVALLRKGVEWVEEQNTLPWADRVWNQNYWMIDAEEAEPAPKETDAKQGEVKNFCGTCYCFAGNVAAWDGYRVYSEGMAKNPRTGESVDPESYAIERLGITNPQAWALFDEENTAEDIRRIAEEIAGQRL
jgi:hypothetical protein